MLINILEKIRLPSLFEIISLFSRRSEVNIFIDIAVCQTDAVDSL